jgi:hypothetical protein
LAWPVFAAEHAWQGPVQAALQQTPSTQLPLPHWLLLPHAAPIALSASQAPVFRLQNAEDTQSLSNAQIERHCDAPHRKGAQGLVPVALHAPRPSHA